MCARIAVSVIGKCFSLLFKFERIRISVLLIHLVESIQLVSYFS